MFTALMSLTVEFEGLISRVLGELALLLTG